MILITGGAGYVGSHFVRMYLSNNPQAEVVIIDNFTEGHKKALDVTDRISLFSENCGNADAMRKIFSDFPISAVVHFAASCYVAESQQNPSKYFQNNVVNTLNLMAVMQEAGIRKFIFSSTCATYGNPTSLPMDESHMQHPVNVYGMTKLIVEQSLQSYAKTLGWSYIALRYFNAAGADDSARIGESHEPETHLIPLVLQTALGRHDFVQINGEDYETPDGTCIRDYIHVNDLAHAHCQALALVESQQVEEAINLGTTCGASVKEVIAMCGQVTGKDIPTRSSPRRSGDPAILVADNKKSSSVLGWKPQYDLRSIVKTAWNWEQNRLY